MGEPKRYAKRILPAALLLALVLVAGLLNSPWLQVFGIDREVFRYSGMAQQQGLELYKDIFDHKPPIIHLVYGAVAWAGPWGDWLLFRLLQWTAVCMLYRCFRNSNPKAAAAVCLLWVAMMNYPPVVTDGGNTRELCASLVLMALCTGYRNRRFVFVWLGLITGLVFFTQPNEVMPLAAPLLYFLLQHLRQPARPRYALLLKRIWQFAAGFAVVAILLAVWLLHHRNFSNFIYHSFTFNSQWYIPADPLGTNFFHVLYKMRVLFTGYLAVAAALAAFLLPHPHRKLAVFICGSLGLSLFSAMLGYNFNHYYTAFVPYIVFLVALPACMTRVYAGKKILPYLVPLAALVLYAPGYWHSAAQKPARNYWIFDTNPAIDRELSAVAGQPGQLFVFNNPQGLRYNSRWQISSPSRWMYQHFWRWPHWDSSLALFERDILHRLDSFNTRFVLYHETDLRRVRPQLVTALEHWLSAHYLPLITQVNPAGDTLRLYKRNMVHYKFSRWYFKRSEMRSQR